MRLIDVIYAKLFRKPLILSHEEDVDGIVSATIAYIKHPDAVVVLARPRELEHYPLKVKWMKYVKWDIVADLPCPPKTVVYVDHHKSNIPRAKIVYHDPEAPAAAVLMAKAMGLEENPLVKKLIEIAVEADTANIVSQEAWDLNDAVKGSDYRGKIFLVKNLAKQGLEVLKLSEVRKWIERHRKTRENTIKLADKIRVEPIMVVRICSKLDIHGRALSIELEKRGALFTCIIVPEKRGRLKLHFGSKGKYDCSIIAKKMGGGGHVVAAGALIEESEERRFYTELKRFLELNELRVVLVKSFDSIEETTV